MSTTLGIIFGILSMIGFGLSNAIIKKPIKKLGPFKTTFFRNIGTSIIFVTGALLFLNTTPSLKALIILLPLAVLGFIAIISFYSALGLGKVGVVSPVAQSYILIIAFFAFILFQETISLTRGISMLIILFGVILLSINFQHLRSSDLLNWSSGIPLALITCISWGFLYSFIKIPTKDLGPLLTAFVVDFTALFLTWLYLTSKKEKILLPKKQFLPLLPYFIAIIIFGSIGFLMYVFGVLYTDISIVAALSTSNPLISTIYARIVYKEKLSLQQSIAAITIILGVVLLSFFS